MTQLTNAQRAFLRKMAHPLKPTVMLGKQGLTEQLLAKLDQELNAHELIKVRLIDGKDQKQELAETIVAASEATLISMVGYVLVLYREQVDPERRTLILPAGGDG
ncbi:ribosome assembly RNA-binding protein YhbY [Candidatus Chloroploca sp. Khr17]|uniref:ribosome assembly RNA-binding protein YhbY n=1 Tax=Candidatus Chloroploca sp. Khr17 TaxID=2496869 RepID=UPI001F1184B9|nr:ribosome assembly RNA-binding protein YhbY [Candidatus Chloroploca sp. Khr17]